MPVFGIVPYRTEARTRSEARIQAEVDRLLLILKTVNDVIRTAEGRLIELFRPPPIFTGPIVDGSLWRLMERESMNERATDRLLVQRRNKPYWINYGNGPLGPFFNVFGSINWPGEMHDVELRNSGWGTLQ